MWVFGTNKPWQWIWQWWRPCLLWYYWWSWPTWSWRIIWFLQCFDPWGCRQHWYSYHCYHQHQTSCYPDLPPSLYLCSLLFTILCLETHSNCPWYLGLYFPFDWLFWSIHQQPTKLNTWLQARELAGGSKTIHKEGHGDQVIPTHAERQQLGMLDAPQKSFLQGKGWFQARELAGGSKKPSGAEMELVTPCDCIRCCGTDQQEEKSVGRMGNAVPHIGMEGKKWFCNTRGNWWQKLFCSASSNVVVFCWCTVAHRSSVGSIWLFGNQFNLV